MWSFGRIPTLEADPPVNGKQDTIVIKLRHCWRPRPRRSPPLYHQAKNQGSEDLTLGATRSEEGRQVEKQGCSRIEIICSTHPTRTTINRPPSNPTASRNSPI